MARLNALMAHVNGLMATLNALMAHVNDLMAKRVTAFHYNQ
jgi:hypothetical protein